MIVVADTSPINYLVLVGAVDVLPKLYERVVIPAAVERELLHRRTPAVVRTWVEDRPQWLEVHSLSQAAPVTLDSKELDPGSARRLRLPSKLGRSNLSSTRRWAERRRQGLGCR